MPTDVAPEDAAPQDAAPADGSTGPPGQPLEDPQSGSPSSELDSQSDPIPSSTANSASDQSSPPVSEPSLDPSQSPSLESPLSPSDPSQFLSSDAPVTATVPTSSDPALPASGETTPSPEGSAPSSILESVTPDPELSTPSISESAAPFASETGISSVSGVATPASDAGFPNPIYFSGGSSCSRNRSSDFGHRNSGHWNPYLSNWILVHFRIRSFHLGDSRPFFRDGDSSKRSRRFIRCRHRNNFHSISGTIWRARRIFRFRIYGPFLHFESSNNFGAAIGRTGTILGFGTNLFLHFRSSHGLSGAIWTAGRSSDFDPFLRFRYRIFDSISGATWRARRTFRFRTNEFSIRFGSGNYCSLSGDTWRARRIFRFGTCGLSLAIDHTLGGACIVRHFDRLLFKHLIVPIVPHCGTRSSFGHIHYFLRGNVAICFVRSLVLSGTYGFLVGSSDPYSPRYFVVTHRRQHHHKRHACTNSVSVQPI
ncbi:hypothetical protein MAPG_09523 [Magnaporthiopsis poae ATCC 64411]|uniref:Uncharacterized protein n=1 Tax=Magnaporthiopsis poae (strain ATCC 64411 / 73-15) TaxID=644358 RepID=A0A0C4EA64_MAGP6|nr:hypothetical protein MAPG_09523 [Magnaporthiopsis poae ATCC 64411]